MPRVHDLRSYYDHVHYSPGEVAARRLRKLTVADPWYRLVLEFLRRNDVKIGSCQLLEVGCGMGGFCLEMASRGAQVTGLDISESAVAEAERLTTLHGRRPAPARFLVADAAALPVRGGAFDLIVCSETLEHTFALSSAFREMYRVCAPGGHAVVTVPNSVLSLPLDIAVSLAGVGQPQVPVNYFTLREAATSAGFRVGDAYGTNFCRTMFSEDVLPRQWRSLTEWLGARVEKHMRRELALWKVLAGTVGLLLRKDP